MFFRHVDCWLSARKILLYLSEKKMKDDRVFKSKKFESLIKSRINSWKDWSTMTKMSVFEQKER
jgi:hypothetical protein